MYIYIYINNQFIKLLTKDPKDLPNIIINKKNYKNRKNYNE